MTFFSKKYGPHVAGKAVILELESKDVGLKKKGKKNMYIKQGINR